MGKYVAYYRVSTLRQGRSGLGLEAQQQAVREFLIGNGAEIVAEFTEVESGSKSDRPELDRALAACRLRGATLVIAKLDRLSRDAAFLLNLQKANVRFVAADMPEANEMVVGIMAVVAQAERKMISDRTKAALAAAKRRGVKLGNNNLTDGARRLGSSASAQARGKRAAQRAADVAPTMRELMSTGLSLRQVAASLNEMGVLAPRGGWWHASSVRNALRLAGDMEAGLGSEPHRL